MRTYFFSACTPYDDPRNYKNLESLQESNDFSVSASLGAIPSDATKIEVHSEMDSGLAMISYKTSEVTTPFKQFNNELPDSQYKIVRRKIGFKNFQARNVRFWCQSRKINAGNELLNNNEILFIGLGDGRVYQWNILDPVLYRELCTKDQ